MRQHTYKRPMEKLMDCEVRPDEAFAVLAARLSGLLDQFHRV